jgi:glycosyltransferase involved in cell wall biosynthesis
MPRKTLMPSISVITPTYNRPDLLSEAIASVRSQSFDDWEMLVAEDGSVPGSHTVVARFGDPRLRYILLEHAGRSTARNGAMELARGDYIGFLDDDDLYHPDKLALEIDFLRSHPDVDLVGSGYRVIDREGMVQDIHKPWLRTPQITPANCLYGVPLITCSVLIARRAIDRLDHLFDPAFDIGEDPDFFKRLILAGARFRWLKEVLSDYRQIHEFDSASILEARRSHQASLRKIFKMDNLPAEIAGQYKDVLINFDLKYAWTAYASHADKIAQWFLLQALIQEPRLANEHVHMLMEKLALFSQNKHRVADPDQFIDYVLKHLPSPLQHLNGRADDVRKLICNE